MKNLMESLKKEYDEFLKGVNTETNDIKKLKSIMEEAAIKISVIEALENFKLIPTQIEKEIYENKGVLDICYKIWKMRNVDCLKYEYTTIFSIVLGFLMGDIKELNDDTIFNSSVYLNSNKIANKITEEVYEKQEDNLEDLEEENEESIIEDLIIGILNMKEAGLPDEEVEEELLETENLLQAYFSEFSRGEINRIIELVTRKILNAQIRITQKLIMGDD